ncbi:unnamed protein product, partial [Sphacelaria rigidula]
MDDLSNFVALEPVAVDTVTHFKNAILARLQEALRVGHQFEVAYSPSSNGTCERMVREVVRALRSILPE